MAARDVTPSFAKIRLKCVATVHALISSTAPMHLFGRPCATRRTISCSRGLSDGIDFEGEHVSVY